MWPELWFLAVARLILKENEWGLVFLTFAIVKLELYKSYLFILFVSLFLAVQFSVWLKLQKLWTQALQAWRKRTRPPDRRASPSTVSTTKPVAVAVEYAPRGNSGRCLICLEDFTVLPSGDGLTADNSIVLALKCSCRVHLHCITSYLHSSLNDKSLVRKEGINCPCCAGETTLGVLDVDDLNKIVRLGQTHLAVLSEEDNAHAPPLTSVEVEKAARYFVEKTFEETENNSESLKNCPLCVVPFWGQLPPADSSDPLRKYGIKVLCPNCRKHFCSQCNLAWHDKLKCSSRVRKNHRDPTENTRLFIDATSKRCPKCGTPNTHYHGHDCHHVRGCAMCGQHFCYVCLAKHETDFSTHQRVGWGCVHRSSNCNSSDIREHLEVKPYPRDTRCGCPICMDCRRGRPCALCSGACVVCRGTVDPGP
jgi:hypothetical protein